MSHLKIQEGYAEGNHPSRLQQMQTGAAVLATGGAADILGAPL